MTVSLDPDQPTSQNIDDERLQGSSPDQSSKIRRGRSSSQTIDDRRLEERDSDQLPGIEREDAQGWIGSLPSTRSLGLPPGTPPEDLDNDNPSSSSEDHSPQPLREHSGKAFKCEHPRCGAAFQTQYILK